MTAGLGKLNEVISLAKSLANRITPGVGNTSLPKAGKPIPLQHVPVPGFADGGKASRRAMMVAKGATSEAPKAYFESAPGKTWNPQQQQSWEALHPRTKALISNKMIREHFKKWQDQTGMTGQVRLGLGGFGGHTNPNYTFEPENPEHIAPALNGLGELFRQDAMMGASAHPFEGSFPSGVIRVHLPPNVHPDHAHEIYKLLNKHGLAEGHSTDIERGTMDILHGEGGDDTKSAAQKVDKLLGGAYPVSSYPTNISFPEHGEHYGLPRTSVSGSSRSSAQDPQDRLQSEASSRLDRLLTEAHRQGGGHHGPVELDHLKTGGAVK